MMWRVIEEVLRGYFEKTELAGGGDPDGFAGGAGVLPRGIVRGGEVSP